MQGDVFHHTLQLPFLIGNYWGPSVEIPEIHLYEKFWYIDNADFRVSWT